MGDVFNEQAVKLQMAIVWCNLMGEEGPKEGRLYEALLLQVDEPEPWMKEAARIYQELVN